MYKIKTNTIYKLVWKRNNLHRVRVRTVHKDAVSSHGHDHDHYGKNL